jgi:hypothetical protein
LRISNKTLVVSVAGGSDDDEQETCTIERVCTGGYNRVFFLREYPDVVVRVSRKKLEEACNADLRGAYSAEIETQRALADRGISPRVFCTVVRSARGARAKKSKSKSPKGRKSPKGQTAPKGQAGPRVPKAVVVGYAMERFDVSLADALEAGYDFGATRSKRALVELFERAATLVRCVDTTASNVVMRPASSSSSSKAGHEFRLIDVDGYFCGTVPSAPVSVRVAMRAWESGSSGPSSAADWDARASSGAYAALGLLVLCVEADAKSAAKRGAKSGSVSGVGWIARMLLEHEVGLVRLLADDSAAQTMVSARDRLVWTHAQVSAMEMVRAYAARGARGAGGARASGRGAVCAPHDVPALLRRIAARDE